MRRHLASLALCGVCFAAISTTSAACSTEDSHATSDGGTRGGDVLVDSGQADRVLDDDAGEPEGWTYDGPRSPCATGLPYDMRTDFPSLPAAGIEAPECTARCGVTKGTFDYYGTVWSLAALPNGSCSFDGEVCSMSAVRSFECSDGQTAACSFTPYVCRCESGNWRCYSGPIGASACACWHDGGT